MKKPLFLFVTFAVLIVLAKFAYHRYCATKPEGCKKEKYDPNQGSPQEGIDW